MSHSAEAVRRRIGSASDLQGVVRTMRALAASGIEDCERSVRSLGDYQRAVTLGLGACLRESMWPGVVSSGTSCRAPTDEVGPVVAIVFGSDQGLVGRFNDVVVAKLGDRLGAAPRSARVWAVGERVGERLADAGFPPAAVLPVPPSVEGIGPLVGRLHRADHGPLAGAVGTTVLVCHNRPKAPASFDPLIQRLLPLDRLWQQRMAAQHWPTQVLPQVPGPPTETLRLLVREHLFISLFRACAESMAAEHASRLAAMERADKNIRELLADLKQAYHKRRQRTIDEELFDLAAGFEALS